MNKKILLILIIPVAVSLGGCFVSKAKASRTVFKNGKNWIPADFNPQKTVLLVQLINEDVVNQGWQMKYKKWNQQMRDYMQEKYPYKYEFASADEIEYKGKKYSDYQKYPYGLMIKDGSYTYSGGAAGSGANNTNTADVYDYYFIERATGKKYPVTKKYSKNAVITFMPVINTILKEKG